MPKPGLSRTGAEVLLGAKKTGLGTGKLVALGGHVEPGESPAQAAVRQVAEESVTAEITFADDCETVAEARFGEGAPEAEATDPENPAPEVRR